MRTATAAPVRPGSVARAGVRGLARRTSPVTLPVAGTGAVVAVWWAVSAADSRSLLVPPPVQVADAFARMGGFLARNAWTTLVEVVAGFVIAAVCGTAMGVVLAWSELASRALWPTLVGLHAAPKLALAPSLVVAFGFGPAPKIIMVVLVCSFPIVLATTTGVTRTPADLMELARSMGAGRWRTFVKLRLPNALPEVLTGLKQAAPLAVIGASIGELFGATAGLGWVVRGAGWDTGLVYAAITLLAVMSVSLFYLMVGLERLLVPWLGHTTS
jgi:NitT/TauT family transport system permease protein